MPGSKPTPLQERFWPKVAMRGPNECWEWTAARTTRGYGVISRGPPSYVQTNASRIAWELANDRLAPAGACVCHSCDNPSCCNPAHLFLADQAANMRDMATKGRGWNQVKTHCSRGHEYTPENTYRFGRSRYCRVCNVIRSRDYRERKAAQ